MFLRQKTATVRFPCGHLSLALLERRGRTDSDPLRIRENLPMRGNWRGFWLAAQMPHERGANEDRDEACGLRVGEAEK